MMACLKGWVRCFLNLRLGWADLPPVSGGLVGCRHGWIFVASTILFFFIVTVAASGVGVDWLAGEGSGGDKLLIFFHMLHLFREFFISSEEF
jgi:hypothetical protein